MADKMDFPETVEEFMEQYKIVDTDEVYTNGAELIPVFRMKQWFEHETLVRCKDCIFGRVYFDVRNGDTDSWVECQNPDGLNRDVSCDGYCSAAIRRKTDEQIHG